MRTNTKQDIEQLAAGLADGVLNAWESALDGKLSEKEFLHLIGVASVMVFIGGVCKTLPILTMSAEADVDEDALFRSVDECLAAAREDIVRTLHEEMPEIRRRFRDAREKFGLGELSV